MAVKSPPQQFEDIFPYEIYVADGADRERLLSWSIRSSSAVRGWIWVLGTRSNRQLQSEPLQVKCCEQVGRLLARNRFGLMTGGYEGVDEAVGKSFTNGFGSAEGEIQKYQRLYAAPGIGLDEELAKKSTVITLNDADNALNILAQASNASIMIGGYDGSVESARVCIENNRPVFPIVETGGAAESFYVKELLQLDEKRKMEIYGSEFDLDYLKKNYKDCIDGILRFLDHRFPLQDTQSTLTA